MRNNFWAQVTLSRGSEGAQYTRSREQTRWQHQPLPMLGKILPVLLMLQLQKLKGVAFQNIFPQKGETLPNPRKFRYEYLWPMVLLNQITPRRNGPGPRKLPRSWKRVLLKRKCSEFNPASPENVGSQFPYSFQRQRAPSLSLQQCPHDWDFLPLTLITNLSINNSRYIFTKGLIHSHAVQWE